MAWRFIADIPSPLDPPASVQIQGTACHFLSQDAPTCPPTRFDISFAVSQLARFCASAGATYWAALHHLMEYVEGLLSFKITYRRQIKHYEDLLSGYADFGLGK